MTDVHHIPEVAFADLETMQQEMESRRLTLTKSWDELSNLMSRYHASLVCKVEDIARSKTSLEQSRLEETVNRKDDAIKRYCKMISDLETKLLNKDSEIVQLRAENHSLSEDGEMKDNLLNKLQAQMAREALEYSSEISALKELLGGGETGKRKRKRRADNVDVKVNVAEYSIDDQQASNMETSHLYDPPTLSLATMPHLTLPTTSTECLKLETNTSQAGNASTLENRTTDYSSNQYEMVDSELTNDTQEREGTTTTYPDTANTTDRNDQTLSRPSNSDSDANKSSTTWTMLVALRDDEIKREFCDSSLIPRSVVSCSLEYQSKNESQTTETRGEFESSVQTFLDITEKSQSQASNTPTKCQYCMELFDHELELEEHEITHIATSASRTVKLALNRLLRDDESGDIASDSQSILTACFYCGEVVTKCTIVQHILERHAGLKCTYCGGVYGRKNALKRHILSHEGVRKRLIVMKKRKCGTCGAIFLSERAYKHHYWQHFWRYCFTVVREKVLSRQHAKRLRP